jgi:hypothetical protein
MKRKLFFFFAVALCITVALPTKAQTGGLGTAQEVGGKKTLPYSFATKAIPASAMEYDSIAGCFIVRDTIVGSSTRSRAASRVETRAASTYNEGGVLYGYFGNQLSSNSMDEMHQLVAPWTAEFINLDVDSLLSSFPDIEKFALDCKYKKCTHVCEDGCNVMDALERGEIVKSRHESYVTLYNELKNIKPWDNK